MSFYQLSSFFEKLLVPLFYNRQIGRQLFYVVLPHLFVCTLSWKVLGFFPFYWNLPPQPSTCCKILFSAKLIKTERSLHLPTFIFRCSQLLKKSFLNIVHILPTENFYLCYDDSSASSVLWRKNRRKREETSGQCMAIRDAREMQQPKGQIKKVINVKQKYPTEGPQTWILPQ